MSEIKMGQLVKDKITGFRGRVTGLVQYITGCNQALVVPKAKDDGSLVESNWFDLERLEVVDSVALRIAGEEVARVAIGPDKPAPRK